MLHRIRLGLHLDPPEHALVLSCDETSQIQALDRTRPLLPRAENLPETRTHDYVRNGATTLFAALNTLDGKVIQPKTSSPTINRQKAILLCGIAI